MHARGTKHARLIAGLLMAAIVTTVAMRRTDVAVAQLTPPMGASCCHASGACALATPLPLGTDCTCEANGERVAGVAC